MGVALATLVATTASGASKLENWRRVDLGTLGGKVAYASGAIAVNERGVVIGNSWNNPWSSKPRSRAFLWRGGRLTDLGTLGGDSSYANSINDRGQIVGWAETKSGKQHAFLWQNGRMRDLGVPPGTDASEAVGITNNGLVAGVASKSKAGLSGSASLHGDLVVWQNGRIRDLGRPWNPSDGAGTLIEALNNRGQIVGSTSDEYLSANGRVFIDRSFLWDGRNLRVLPPRSARSKAVDMNEHGEIIGWTYRNDFRAVVWKQSQMRLLPLPPGQQGAFARAINDKNEIVGYTWNDREEKNQGILWRNGAAIQVGTLGGEQSEAIAINNHGQIVGKSETATNDSDGSPIWHAFVWRNDEIADLGNGDPIAINERGQVIGSSNPTDGHAVVWLPR